MTASRYAMEGASTVINNLASQFSKQNIDVTIGALSFTRPLQYGRYSFCALPVYNALKLTRFLDGFDIIHNHHSLTNYLSLISRRPFLYHYHGAPDLGAINPLWLSMLLSIKIVNWKFDAVIAVSKTGAKELKKHFGLKKVNVIYNGVNTSRFKEGLEQRFRKGSPQFLFVGKLYKHKKVKELILGLRELIRTYPNAFLQIVGNGPMYVPLKRFVDRLKLKNNVELVGQVSDNLLPYHYSSCDVYVTASRWELFDIPLLEAMASGKPVIASAIGPHMELIAQSNAGVTYTMSDIDDLHRKMTMTFEEGYRYRWNGLHFAEEHDWSMVADKILEVYNQTLHINTM